jgi:hypothetical protein
MKNRSNALRHFTFVTVFGVAVFSGSANLRAADVVAQRGSSDDLMTDSNNPISTLALPAGYALLNANEDGQIFCCDKPAGGDVRNALESALGDLAQVFGQRPIPGAAYEDYRDHRSGGATFSAAYHGHAARGLITCKLSDQGAHVVVIFCRADAPAGAWGKLTSVLTGAEAPAGAPPADARFALTIYNFSDQTGSIGVADGWKVNAPSIFSTIRIDGPNDANVTLGSIVQVDIPGTRADQLAEHFHAKHFVAPFTDPTTAMKDLWPQISRANQAVGGPAVQIDRFISEDPLPPTRPEEKASLIVFDVIRTQNGRSRKFRSEQIFRMQLNPQQPGHWQIAMRGFSAPVEVFDQEAPKMLAMAASLQVNEVVTARVGKAIADANAAVAAASLEAFRQRGIQQQKAHDAYMAGQNAQRDRRLANFNADQLRKSRNNADQVEAILNVTKIVDTRTGTAARVNLTDANTILNTLNSGQQGRFQQLHLRDELYPGQKP